MTQTQHHFSVCDSLPAPRQKQRRRELFSYIWKNWEAAPLPEKVWQNSGPIPPTKRIKDNWDQNFSHQSKDNWLQEKLHFYYILWRKLLHFELVLHFVSVITFCGVTVATFEIHRLYENCTNYSLFLVFIINADSVLLWILTLTCIEMSSVLRAHPEMQQAYDSTVWLETVYVGKWLTRNDSEKK